MLPLDSSFFLASSTSSLLSLLLLASSYMYRLLPSRRVPSYAKVRRKFPQNDTATALTSERIRPFLLLKKEKREREPS